MRNGELLTISELADYLYVESGTSHYKRALRFVQSSGIKSITAGARIYVTRTEVNRYLGNEGAGDDGDSGEE